MATDLGKAYVQIMPSAQGIKGEVEKILGKDLSAAGDSAGKSLGGSIVKAVTGFITAAGIGKFFSSSLMGGANLQQSLGGIETLFKGSADTVKKYAAEAYKTTGLSANAYMENVTGFSASLLQSLGGDTSKSAEIANMAMIDMSDNANKMGTDMGRITDAYQGFAKQNYTMLDNLKLGYGGTKTEMERLLADAEKLTGVKYDINNLSDVYQAIHAIQENLDITGTTAEEAASTFSGSFASMKAAAQNVLGQLALGEDIGPALQTLADTTSTFLMDNFLPMVGNIIKGGLAVVFGEDIANSISDQFNSIVEAVTPVFDTLKDLFSEAADKLKEFTGWLKDNPAVLDAMKASIVGITAAWTGYKIVTGIIKGIEAIRNATLAITNGLMLAQFVHTGALTAAEAANAAATMGASGAFGIFNAVLSANPIGIIVTAIAALTAGLIWFFTQTETGQQIWAGFMDWLQSAWQGISDFCIALWNNVADFFTNLWNSIKDVAETAWEGIASGIMAVVQPFIDAWINLWNSMKDGLSQIWEGVKMIFTGVWEFIKAIFLGAVLVIVDLVTGNFTKLGEDLGLIWDAIKNAVSLVWEGIKTYFSGVVNTIVGYGTSVFNSFSNALSAIWNTIKSVASSAWEGLKSGVLNIINGLVSGAQRAWDTLKRAVSDTISRVTSIFNGLKNIDLFAAGRAIIDGFLRGLRAAFDGVKNFVGGIANWIRDHKGPIEYDRKLLIPAGDAIMSGLDEGLKDKFKDVQSTVRGIAGDISDVMTQTDYNFDTTADVNRQLQSNVTFSNQDMQLGNSTVTAQINQLQASVENLLGKLVEKDTTMYLDGDVIAQSVYNRQGRIYAREGI